MGNTKLSIYIYILLLLGFAPTGCSSCVNDQEVDPWDIEETRANEFCQLDEPNHHFEQTDDNLWKRVFTPENMGCAEYQATVSIQSSSDNTWRVNMHSRACNRCDETQYIRADGSSPNIDKTSASDMLGFLGVQDQNNRHYIMRCGDKWAYVDTQPLLNRKVFIDPGMMLTYTYQIRTRYIHPDFVTDEFQRGPYFSNPVNFDDILDIIFLWPAFQPESAANFENINWGLDHVICSPEFSPHADVREITRKYRDRWYHKQVILEPEFPEPFATFLRSRNFSQ